MRLCKLFTISYTRGLDGCLWFIIQNCHRYMPYIWHNCAPISYLFPSESQIWLPFGGLTWKTHFCKNGNFHFVFVALQYDLGNQHHTHVHLWVRYFVSWFLPVWKCMWQTDLPSHKKFTKYNSSLPLASRLMA